MNSLRLARQLGASRARVTRNLERSADILGRWIRQFSTVKWESTAGKSLKTNPLLGPHPSLKLSDGRRTTPRSSPPGVTPVRRRNRSVHHAGARPARVSATGAGIRQVLHSMNRERKWRTRKVSCRASGRGRTGTRARRSRVPASRTQSHSLNSDIRKSAR